MGRVPGTLPFVDFWSFDIMLCATLAGTPDDSDNIVTGTSA